MKVFSCKLQFHTPAFLGDAEQNGAWRTPPIKALLRQFWRMDHAASQGWAVDTTVMRKAEGRLFGVAADRDSRKSEVRIRLSRWDEGKLKSWNGLDATRIPHPEVRSPVGAQLYLGYGPLTFRAGTTALKSNAAIQPNESADLHVAVPDDYAAAIEFALAMMDRFGTLGGRSRNGWGSFSLAPIEASATLDLAQAAVPMRDWREALALDWPHAIGRDDRGALVWQTDGVGDWKALMTQLAEIKIAFRTQFKFTKGATQTPEARDWLSYPVTNHSVGAWDRNARLPNSLRFKVRKHADGKLHGIIVHFPCLPPAKFHPDQNAIESVWQRVHDHLDSRPDLTRCANGVAP